ncbi:adenosylmethionine--8-amino-7-oxononanoate transaminase [Aciditerrimonas ferrireducens]|nr:adenosylmethionine--8-amino-7-oxononanoate transaminase [Aciditerrimonas ferrireducens]MCK4176534.1 adenosylmethionine--8-amino-7-oxononanoate transaminase [Aciditerrimonas ferrireducens]
MARDQAVVWHGFTQMACFAENAPVIVERAEGRHLVDVAGRRYFDGISSLWVTTLGHRVPALDAAVREQLDKVAHSTLLGNGNRVVVELAEALAEVVPVERPHVLFASDGASAVEQALKICFQFWANQGAGERNLFLCLGAAYHGDSVGSLSLGAGGFETAVFDPLRFPVLRTPGYDHPGWAEAALAVLDAQHERLAALVLEPLVQGASGMLVAEPEDVARVVRAAQERGVLVVADEVATGFGRTGALFASEVCGIRPEVLCLGKGLTGGYLPMSATVCAERVYEAFLGEDLGPRTLAHGHSFGGNALAAAVALAHLRLVRQPWVLAGVAALAEQLADLLARRVAKHPAVREVRQRGLMTGVELVPPRPGLRWGRRVCAAAVRRGVLLRPLGDVIVLMPPLTTTAAEAEELVEVLAGALAEVCEPDLAAASASLGEAGSTQAAPVPLGPRAWGPAGARWADRLAARREALVAAGRWRAPRVFDAFGVRGRLAGRGRVVSFAGNDYLGLSTHPAVRAAASAALARWGSGAGASRLVTGTRPVHEALEEALARWAGEEDTVVFPSGFAANLAVLGALGGEDVLICSDERNHASIVDGCRLSRAQVAVYPHGDLEALEARLGGHGGPAVVVSDTVFSMDGDWAPVEDLAECCRRHGALLVLDEAHGVLGPDPGAALEGVAHARVGTLSKHLGSQGGFVAGSRPLVDLVRNLGRSWIFTTALSPADAAAALAALEVLGSAEGQARRAALAERTGQLVAGLRALGLELPAAVGRSPIVPVVLGEERAALAVAEDLEARGFLVPAIRPPTVPPGTSRLRVTLSAEHRPEEVEGLLGALAAVLPGGGRA